MLYKHHHHLLPKLFHLHRGKPLGSSSHGLGHRMPGLLVKCEFWVCPSGCVWRRLVFELMDSIKQVIIPTMWVGTTQSTEGLNRAKGRGRKDSLSAELRPSSSPARGCRGSWFQTFPWGGTAGFPGPPGCRPDHERSQPPSPCEPTRITSLPRGICVRVLLTVTYCRAP